MREHRYSDAAFAAAVTEKMTAGREVKSRTVTKWRLGTSMPRRPALGAIATVTEGAITANDFVELAV